jgi:hypothetical protein
MERKGLLTNLLNYFMNSKQEKVIKEVNKRLSTLELKVIEEFNMPEKPVFIVVGAPRSGTTLLLQTIIEYFNIGYVNNYIAKYWEAPVIGAILFQSMNLNKERQSFISDSGFTTGIHGPHEFGYFWKRFFKYEDSHQIKELDYPSINHKLLNKEISGLEDILKKPMIFKNPPALSLQIKFFNKYVPNTHFIYIKRDPKFIAQSIYLKRKQIYKDEQHWYSTKPAEYQYLKEKDPIEQIAGQVFYTIRKIENDLYEISDNSKTIIDYEDFCRNPIKCINTCEKLRNLKISSNLPECEQLTFEIKDKILVDQKIWDSFDSEFNKYYMR